ncbi:MAG: hypothetical protein IKH15_09345 [Bacteroidales bacterium]|nr:hypothetical protein [Bacteroidales bacterium]
MLSVFYTQTLEDGNMPIGVKIIYSQVIFRAVVCDGQSFDTDGEFDLSLVKEFEDDWCHIGWVRNQQIARDLGITRMTVYNAKRWLEEYDLIRGDRIYIPEGFFDRFFELQTETGLTGWPLVVYSYIYNKNRKYRYVDSYRTKIAKELHVGENHLSLIIGDLIRGGWIIKERNWKNWKLRCR